MAGQSITFSFLSTGAAALSRDFRSVGDDSALSSRAVRVLSDVIERLGAKEDRTAAESVLLAKALKQTGDAADRVTARTVLADAAIRKLSDGMAEASKKPLVPQVLAGKALASLTGIQAKAEELRAKFPQFTVQINDRAAKLELALFAAEAKGDLDKIDRQLNGAGGRGGILGRIPGLGGGGAVSAAPAAGGLPGGVLAGAGIAGVAVALSGAGGILPLIAAATLGIGSFGALALPTFTKVSGTLTRLSADQAAYNAAQTRTAQNTAARKIAADWAALDPAQRQAVKGIQGIGAEFGKLARQLEPDVFKVFNAGLKAASALLPALLPLARAVAPALQGLLQALDKFATSGAFKAFIANMASLAGPAVTAIGTGLGKITASLGKLLVAMESPDGLRILNGLFTALSGTLNVIAFAFTRLTPVIVASFHNWAAAFDDLRHNVASDVHQISDYIDTIRVTWVTVGHAIEATWNTLTAGFAQFRHSTANVFNGIRTDIAGIWTAIWSNTRAVVSAGVSAVAGFWRTLQAGVVSAYNTVRTSIATAWTSIWNATRTAVTTGISNVVTWFTGLPAKIIAALGAALTLLSGWGKDTINGMLAGMKSVITDVWTFIKGIPGQILKFLHLNSPPKWAIQAGIDIMNGFGIGMVQAQGALKKGTALFQASAASAAAGAAAGAVNVPQSNRANQALGQRMAAAVGWTGAQWNALNTLIGTYESGWSSTVTNPSSGAAGIAQNISGFGPGYGYGNAAQQITWLLGYIASRYGSPVAALAFELSHTPHWYAGGTSSALPGWAWVGERGRELVRFRGGEQVLPAGSVPGGDLVAEVRALRAELRAQMEKLTGVAAAIPARTGQHVGGAINGAAGAAAMRRRFPQGGW